MDEWGEGGVGLQWMSVERGGVGLQWVSVEREGWASSE